MWLGSTVDVDVSVGSNVAIVSTVHVSLECDLYLCSVDVIEVSSDVTDVGVFRVDVHS